MGERERFHPLFEQWARGVRSRLLARRVLTGLAVGLALAVLAAALAWKTRHGALRPLCALAGLVGAGVGVAIARRKRWSDVDVALWLDDRLETDETITTAVELRNQAEDDDEARAVVVSSAASALAEGDAKRARPAVLRPHPRAGAHRGRRARLHRALADADAADRRARTRRGEGPDRAGRRAEEDREARRGGAHATTRRSSGSKRSRRTPTSCSADLEKGLEKREALDRIAKLRDEIAAEKLTLGEGEKRAGLEAAISKLEQNDSTKEAAKALGDHDLEKMDRRDGATSRTRARSAIATRRRRALEDAAAAAKANGAPDVGKALEQEKKSLEEREKRAEAAPRSREGDGGLGARRAPSRRARPTPSIARAATRRRRSWPTRWARRSRS